MTSLKGQTAASSDRPMPESDQFENTIYNVMEKELVAINHCRTHVQSKTNYAQGKRSALGKKIPITWT